VVLAMGAGVFLINHGLSNWLPELLRSGGMTAAAAGNWAALPMLVGAVGSLIIPRLATPERRYRILLVLSLAAAAASLALLVVHPLVLPVALVLQGLVRASLMTVLILTLVELPGLDARYAGTASGLFFTAAEVGGVLGPLGLGLMYDVTGGFDAGLYALTAVAAAMALGTVRLAALVRQGR
jgi:cyanate permease